MRAKNCDAELICDITWHRNLVVCSVPEVYVDVLAARRPGNRSRPSRLVTRAEIRAVIAVEVSQSVAGDGFQEAAGNTMTVTRHRHECRGVVQNTCPAIASASQL